MILSRKILIVPLLFIRSADATSQLTITFNAPIQMIDQAIDASINTLVNVNVFNSAVTNVGDILTTTIVQQPSKGTASIQQDGTIDYVAAENTVGVDVITFQVCINVAIVMLRMLTLMFLMNRH